MNARGPEAFPHDKPMFCVIDMRTGELVCNVEAMDSAEAVCRALSVAGLLGKPVHGEDLAAAPVDEPVCAVPTFNDAYFVQEGLFGAPPGTPMH